MPGTLNNFAGLSNAGSQDPEKQQEMMIMCRLLMLPHELFNIIHL